MRNFTIDRSDTRTNKTKRWLGLLTYCMALLIGQLGFAQNSIIIGSVTTNTNGTGSDPIDDYYSSMRYQTVYTAAELIEAGLVPYNELTGLGFSVTEGTNTALLNYTIRIGHTSASDAASHVNSLDLQVVRNSASYSPTVVAENEFDMLSFDTNFVWNGVDNIVVDICTGGDNPYSTPYGGVRVHPKTNGSRFYRSDISGSMCSATSGTSTGTTTNRPQINFTFVEGTPPSCFPPGDLASTITSYTSADISWGTLENAIEYEYAVTTSATAPTSGTVIAGTSASVDELTANTTYYLHVRANCDTDGVSTWSTKSFYTGYCTPIGTSNSYRITGVSTTNGFGSNINNLANGTSSGYNDYSATHIVSQYPGGEINYTITVPGYTAVKIWIDLNNDFVFDSSELVAAHTTYGSNTSWSGTLSVPSDLPFGDYHMRIRSGYSYDVYPNQINPCGASYSNYGEAEDYTLSVVAPPACIPPAGLGFTQLSTTSANLFWIGEGVFELVYGETGFDHETATPIEASNTNYTITDLVTDANYQFYVRKDCTLSEDGYSNWTGPFSFKVGYCTLTTPSNNDASGIKNVTFIGNGMEDDINNPSTSTGHYSNYSNISTTVTAGESYDLSVNVDTASDSFSTYTVYTRAWIDWNNNGVFETDESEEYNLGNTIGGNNNPTSLSPLSITIPDDALGSYRMRIKTVYGTTDPIPNPCTSQNYSEAEDYTIIVMAAPCPEPTDFATTTVFSNSAVLSWNGTASSFDIEYGVSGFTPGTGTTINEVTSPYEVLELDAETEYDVYVKGVCIANESDWVGPVSFTTLEEPITTPACEVVVELNFPEWGDYVEWEITDADGDIVISGGLYEDSNFTITETFMASNPPYSLEINIDDQWCDNWVYYTITVGGSVDATGEIEPCEEFMSETIEIGSCPSCSAPHSLAATTTATGADLSWTGTALAYDIEWGTFGFTSGNGTVITGVTTTSYTLPVSTGAYQYYVRQDCGSGDISNWAGPYVFVVGGYDGGDIPTQHNFNPSVTSTDFCTPEATITIDVPEGMQIASLQVFYSMTATTDDINGTFSDAYMSEQRSFIYSPTLEMGESSIAEGDGDSAGIYHYNRTLSFANEATGSVDFVLRAWRTWAGVTGCNTLVNYVNNGSWVIVPTFQPVPPCTTPTALTATPGDNNEVDLTWTSTGELFDIEYGPTGFTLGSGTTVTGITASPYTLALPTAGAYQFYVRQDCENNLSAWAGPFSFIIGAYNEGNIPTQYNTAPTVASTDYCTPEPTITIEVPEGMQIAQLHVQYSMTAQNVAWMNEQRSFIYSPTLEEGETTLAAGVGGTGGTYNYSRSLGDLGYGATGSVDFVLRAWRTWTSTGQEGCSTYNSFVVNGTWVITPTFEVIPTCPKPMDLAATATGFNEAILSWTSEGTSFDIEFGETGFIPTGTPSAGHTGVSNNYTLTGLDAETNYQYYVRQDCGDGDFSVWSGPFSFYTGYCIPTSTIVSTAYRISGFSTTDGYTNISNENNGFANAYNNYSNMAVTQSEGGTFNFNITVPAWTMAEVWVDLNQDLQFDPEMELLVSFEDYGTTGNTVFNGSMMIPLGTPEGDYRMRVRSRYYFQTTATPCGPMQYGETEDYTISVVPVPACMPPSALSAASLSLNTAELAWFSDGELFDIEFGPTGFTPTGTPSISGIANPYILTTPNPGSYQYYVRQDCDSDGTSLWAGPFGFVVGAYQDGDIPTRYNTGPSISSTDYCTPDPIITIEVPEGMQIATLHVSYNMTAAGGAWMSEQRSFIYSPTLGIGETALSPGTGGTAGTMNYSRSMNFANGAIGTVEFALRAWRTFGNTSPNDGCSTYYNKVDNGTWVITPTFEPLPPCPTPLALAADVTSYNEAILSWMSTGASFDIEYGETGFTPTGTPSDGHSEVSNNYTLTGLEAETHYQYYVRQTCGEDGTSDWAGPFAFYTGYCIPSSTFTGYRILGFSTTDGYTNISNENNGIANSYNNYSYMAVTLSPEGTFNYSITVPAWTMAEVWIDLDQDLNFDPDMELLASFENYGTVDNTVFTGNMTIPLGTPEGDYRMRVRSRYYFQTTATPCGVMQYGETEDYTISIVPLPACLPPTGVTATPLSITSAEFAWVSTGSNFDIEWGEQGFTQGTGELITDYGSTSIQVTDLIPGTTYSFYVRQDCGDDGESLWAGPVSVYVGYCESVPTSNDGSGITNVMVGSVNFPVADVMYYEYTGSVADIAAGTTINSAVTFATGFTYNTNIWIDLNNDGIFDNTTELVFQGESTNANPTTLNTSFSLDASTSLGERRMRIGTADGGQVPPNPCYSGAWGVTIDLTVNITPPPSCLPPMDLSVDGVTFTTADLSWESDGDLFDVEYGLTGFTPTGTPSTGYAGITDTSVTLTDLTAETHYQFYVRQDCGDDDTSIWTGPFPFFTGYCAVTSTSTTYGIGNFVTTGGITNISNATGPGSYNNYTSQSVSQFEGGAPVNFTITSANGGTCGMGIWIDWNNDMDFTDDGEQVYNSQGYINPGSGSITIPAGTPVGNYRMRVVANWLSGTATPCGGLGNAPYGEAEDYTFTVIEQPTCMPPSALTHTQLTMTSAELSWTSDGTLFDIEWGVAGFTPTGNPTPDFEGVGDSVVLTELTVDTNYQYYVRRDCGDEDGTSLWAGPYTFSVGYCAAGATNTGFEKISNVTFVDINNPSTSTAGYENFTSVSTDVTQGETYDFSASFTGTSYEDDQVLVWIDFNQNGVFTDPGELVLTTATGESPWTGSITIPTDALPGATRMRVRLHDSVLLPNATPCGNSEYGQVEDYTVVIIGTDPCASIIAPTGDAAQSLTLGDTLADLDVTGTNLVWYADADLTNEIADTTLVVNGTTYYVVSQTDECQSDALAITVTVIDPCASIVTPTGASEQSLLLGQTIAGLNVSGTNLVWYADATLTTIIPTTTLAVNGTTYYVVSQTEECQSDALAITVTVIDPCAEITTPTGDAIQTVAEGTTLAELDVNGTSLAWYADAELTQSLLATTVVQNAVTYYVASVTDICQSEPLAITVYLEGVDPCEGVTVPTPTGEATQTVDEGTTLANLIVEGENLQWYADADLTEALEDTHVAEDNTTYYVTQTIGLCTSEALAVHVLFTVGREDFDSFAFRFYPNPVGEVLNLTSNSEISTIDLFNMLGQKVTVVANANNTQIDMSGLPTGNYIISVTIEGVTKTFKVVKN